ncbi:4-coumarate--CoA ligase 1-like [Coccinella septempunctata]|uniref:4-coumarate--CoA ligase 1-like n=1 Tax=Coccinella septempunctata TaxID=41139 RepID=UPI001D0928D0|nr:4-coumarate--CoA ligase 1-like [Coccinella septempunctata]
MHRHRNRIAQIIEKTEEKQTFEELLNMSICTALKLKDRGLDQNDIACVCLSNGKYTSVPYLAGLFLGFTMSAIDVTFNVKDIAFFLKLAKPSIIFVDTEKLADIEEALLEVGKSIKIIVVGDSIEGLENIQDYLVSSIDESRKFTPYQVKSMRENCAIFFSSGTSGYPKAICLSHFNLLYQIVYASVTCNLNDVLLSYTSFYWISGVILLGYCILTGSPRILPMPFDVSRFYKLLDKHKVIEVHFQVQIAFLGPHECIALIKSNKPEKIVTSSLKWIVAGGAALKEDAVSSLKCSFQSCNVIQSYGQTETAGPMFRWDITKPEDFELCIAKPASIGRPCGGIWYKVTDENTGSILGPYKTGEICIKSDTLIMNGYYRRDASECFDSNGWLKTGDLGYYDEYHCFYIMDRIKELIKYKGWHVPPLILENLLLKHPVVANAVVIGIPHPEDGEHPTGFIILEHGVDPASVNLQDISEFVNRQVDEKKHLRGGVVIVESFPLTVTGKVNRRILRDSLLRMNVIQKTK